MRQQRNDTQRHDAIRSAVVRTSGQARRYQVQVRATFVRLPRARSAAMAS